MQNPTDRTAVQTRPGTVFLVGAGPGDPGLITARGVELLGRADVVVYDALANPALLSHARPDAQQIYVGKRAAAHTLTQQGINELLEEKAKEGLMVVRLKGGDPYLFGRGAEELVHLARQGVPCEVVPGVTSGIAAPAMGGIPVTHRSIASTVTFVTGHERPDKEESAIDYRALALLLKSGGTVCFYMGVGRLEAIAAALCGHGLSPQTPVGIVQWGTLPRQRSLRTTLATAEADVVNAGLGPPAIIVVGQVAAIQEPGLDFFTRRPLFGQRILVTRTRQQASDLTRRLAEQGAQVIEAPTIQLLPPDNWDQVDDAIRNAGRYHWVVLTSPNGVDAIARRLETLALDGRQFAGVKIAAIGEATAQALQQRLGLRADLVPTRYVAESLAAELIAGHDVRNQSILLLTADIARPALPQLLNQAGARVQEITAYQTGLADGLPDEVVAMLENRQLDWVTFTSSSTATNLVQLLADRRSLLRHVRIASIGPITSQTVRDLGFEVVVEAQTSTVPGFVDAIVEHAVRHGAASRSNGPAATGA